MASVGKRNQLSRVQRVQVKQFPAARALRRRQAGRTLLELVITMAIIGIAASAAMPAYDPVQQSQLSLAATSVADATRFARERARYFGSPHGVEVDKVSQRVRIFRLDLDVDPTAKIFDVYHPISKQLYSLNFGSDPYKLVVVEGVAGAATGPCGSVKNLVFDTYGVVRCLDPSTSRFNGPTITLELDGVKQHVKIDGFNGRVTLQ